MDAEAVLLEHHRATLEATLFTLCDQDEEFATALVTGDSDAGSNCGDDSARRDASGRALGGGGGEDSSASIERSVRVSRTPSTVLLAEHRLCVTISILTYWFAVSLVPVWNKRVMHADRFPYAIATATIQLGTVAAVLFFGSILEHYWLRAALAKTFLGRRWGGRGGPLPTPTTAQAAERHNAAATPLLERQPSTQAFYRDAALLHERATRFAATHHSSAVALGGHADGAKAGGGGGGGGGGLAGGEAHFHSWVLGPHLRYKLRTVMPIGLLFGLKYSITNLGLMLLPTSTHLLLQGTDIVWTVAAAHCINRERIGRVELSACALCFVGSTLLSIRVGATLTAPLLPLCINLASPMLLGLCISTLRVATVELMRVDGPLKGTMSHGELTCFKLILSALTALVGAMLLEGAFASTFSNVHARASGGGSAAAQAASTRPWWSALASLDSQDLLGLLGGSALVLIFQVNITWLTHLTSAVSVGLVGGVKIVPQWAAALLFEHHLDASPANLTGAMLIMVSGAIFTYGRSQRAPRVLANAADPTLGGAKRSEASLGRRLSAAEAGGDAKRGHGERG